MNGDLHNTDGITTSLTHSWALPAWVTVVALLATTLFIWFIYRSEAGAARATYRYVMAFCRIMAIAVLFVMLYGWTQQQHQTDPPELVIAHDVSKSMADSSFDPLASVAWQGVTDRYQLHHYSIGERARQLDEIPASLTATEDVSRLGLGLRTILDRQRGRSTAAIVLVTDGLNNDGPLLSDVATEAAAKSIPLYILGVGRTQPDKDARIGNVVFDRTAFAGDVVGFRCQIHASKYEGRSAKVILRRAGSEQVLAEESISLPADGAADSVHLTYRAMQTGDFEHTIELEAFADDTNPDNNRSSHIVQVRDPTVKILLAQSSPSYEFRFLRDLLRRSTKISDPNQPAIELTTVLQEADIEYAEQEGSVLTVFPSDRGELFEYDVLIIGDLDPRQVSRQTLQNIADFVSDPKQGGGVALLAGPRFMPVAYAETPLALLLLFDPATAILPSSADEDVYSPVPTDLGVASRQIQLSDSLESSSEVWRQLPQLRWHVASEDVPPTANVLVEAHHEASGGRSPLIISQFVGAGRTLFHATDETYLWSRHQGSDKYYARCWLQAVRYLSGARLLADEGGVELTTNADRYSPGDVVRVQLQFDDSRQAPADGVDVSLEHEQGARRNVPLQRDQQQSALFTATLSDLPSGQYTLRLATPLPVPEGEENAAPVDPRRFTIDSPQADAAGLVMNARDLRLAAKRSRGRFYLVDDADRLVDDLPRGEPVKRAALPAKPLWNSPLLACLFVALLTVEWIMRKRAAMV